MSVSLPVLNRYFKEWLESRVRIDDWSLEVPSVLVTKIDGRDYAANTAVQFPPIKVEFEPTSTGIYAKAEFHFRIQYRFNKNLEYHQVPINSCCAILNNLYLTAVNSPTNIHPSIKLIQTPTDGIDVFINEPDEQGQDWIVTLNPQFYTEFKAAIADDFDLNPPSDGGSTTPINQFAIAIYRSDLGTPDPSKPSTYDLDRRYTFSVINGNIQND